MSQISSLQREIYGSHELIFVKPSRQRSKSQPIPKRRRRLFEDEQAPLDKRRERSASLKDRFKQFHERMLTHLGCKSTDDESSDSDGEDQWSLIPTIHTLRRGGKFNSVMKARVAEKHQELLECSYELRGELYTAKQRYNNAREWLYNTARSDWSAGTCRKYRELEDNYLNLTRKVFELDDNLNELEAMLLSFGGGVPVPVPVGGRWNMNRRGSRVWSLDNASYEWESPESLDGGSLLL
ncbi:uncharacterized protein F4812DRAFT_461672 [Daldinia caldariorum]|uniref:uncharacterized protein n=1 Tax=Daldinia caldariorum TaxID=326644 RepID=UPI002008D61B|nr:uncharacterized protein F4812DRAFT_461672 [Daldinia caldariorum]KAI1465364.1 hypothetical protein F4812DRAFT_461672 [Daldinia caldariorum]